MSGISQFYTGSEVSATTRARAMVLQRDGSECWLCGQGPGEFLKIAHQVGAADIGGVSYLLHVTYLDSRFMLNAPSLAFVVRGDAHYTTVDSVPLPPRQPDSIVF